MKTAGTQLYFIDPDDDTVSKVGCPTAINGVDSERSQIENTCLEETEARTYVAGLGEPGQATFTINFDVDDETHKRLHDLKRSGDVLKWAIGFSDGVDTAPDTSTEGGDWDMDSPTRTFLTFEGYISSYPFDFSLNELVSSDVGIQVSGEPKLHLKSAP